MRKSWLGVHMMATGLLVLASCSSGPDKYKPTPQPERIIVPPSDEARFSQPVAYPKQYLNKDNPKKDDDAADGISPTHGAGRGMGGGGYEELADNTPAPPRTTSPKRKRGRQSTLACASGW